MDVTDRIFTHSPVLGTFVTVSVAHVDDETAGAVDREVLGEIDRLESILSRYRADSALERWKRDELVDMPPDLATVMCRASEWTAQTGGALDVRAGAVTELWRRAVAAGHRPTDEEISAIVRRFGEPGFEIDPSGVPRRIGDCTDLDLHCFAKGWIVDRALEVARNLAPEAAIAVNAGGDVARAGPGVSMLAIDDPFRPYDNAPPIDRVAISLGGLATSGDARDHLEIDGRRFSHIIDPRTGQPADGAASVSIIAASAESADAWATALAIASPEDVIAHANDAGVAVMAVWADRSIMTNDRWREHRSMTGTT